MPDISLDPFARALGRLEEGLARHRVAPDDDQLRDGLVQRFEYAWEQAHKALKRVLEATAADPDEVDRMTFQTLIRTGNEQGLVPSDWPAWRTFRELRARTSHTYLEEAARAVVDALPAFIAEARGLCDALAARLREPDR